MWHVGTKHWPAHPRYQEYWDLRPILPQDSTRGLFGFRGLDDPYRITYLNYMTSKKNNYLLLNNVPAEEREKLKTHYEYYGKTRNLGYLALFPTIAFQGLLKSNTNFKRRYLYGLSFVYFYYIFYKIIRKEVDVHVGAFYLYYYQKYKHLTSDSLNKVEDKRRKFYTPDKDVYYRETAQEIFDKKNADQHHDGSIYYGPHPFNDHENNEDAMEISKKFFTGKSKFDENETLLDEPIDIKRRVRQLPTQEDYKKI